MYLSKMMQEIKKLQISLIFNEKFLNFFRSNFSSMSDSNFSGS